MIAGGYLWLTHSNSIVTAWDTRYGVQSFSTIYDNSSSPSQIVSTVGGGVVSDAMNGSVSGTISIARSCSDSTTTLVQISAVLVSDNGSTTTTNIKDTSTTTTATTTTTIVKNHRQYQYYLTTAVSVEGTTRATSVIHGPLPLPPGDPPCSFLAF